MKNLNQVIKIIILGIILSGGLALAFTAPSASYPNGNTEEPVDVSANGQVKTGAFSVGPLLVTAGNTNFYGGVKIAHPSGSPAYNLYIAGNTGVAIQPAAKLDVLGNVKAASLVHGNATTPRRVCADVNGLMSLCPTGSMHVLSSTSIGGATCGTMVTGCTWSVPDGVYKLHVVVKGGGGGNAVVKDLIVNPANSIKMIVGDKKTSSCSSTNQAACTLGDASDLYINGTSYAHGDPNSGWVNGYIDLYW